MNEQNSSIESSNTESKKEYIHRIHKVQDYIEAHLYEPILIEDLAAVAGFSKYHFERIFTSIVKEPLFHYVNRMKLEKAIHLLIHRKDLTVTQIAYHFGYTDSAIFSRTFKTFYGVSPSAYRNQYSKNCKEPLKITQYTDYVTTSEATSDINSICDSMEVITIKAIRVIYVRHTGTYKALSMEYAHMLKQLYEFAQKYHLQDSMRLLTVYHDNPEITNMHQLRTSLCMEIPDELRFNEGNEFGCMSLTEGKYMVGHFYMEAKDFPKAWDYMYGEWLTNSGYQPREAEVFEDYLNDPKTDPQHKAKVDFYFPIERL